jgi:hypothetical protein
MNSAVGTRAVRVLSLVTMAGLLALSPISPAKGNASASCPGVEFMDMDAVKALPEGTAGYGLTVARGRSPERFGVSILGVLEDGILPGRDLIVVETSGDAIDRAGGIWAGMSGSPVYVNDQLVGAVAYGLSWGPSAIGGVTPAEDMMKLVDRPSGGATATAQSSAPSKVQITKGMRRDIARAAGVTSAQVSSSFSRLKLPVSVSGGADVRRQRLRRTLKRFGVDAIPYAGSSSSGASAAAGTFEPGGNFAAALSYGDLTIAGVGTTTVVCGDKAIAFGHPFTWEGRVSMGASTANALTVVDDPLFGPYKLANVDQTITGTLDQDRLAGVRAVVGTAPERIPIRSEITALDGPDAEPQAGETDSLESEATPWLAFLHLLLNIDSEFDRIGEGTSAMAWTVEGRDSSGRAWSFERSNVFASEWDISYETSDALLGTLYSIFYNDFEEITFTSIDTAPVTVDEDLDFYTVTNLKISIDGGPFRSRQRARVRPGARVAVKAILTSFDDDSRTVERFSFRVSRRARGEGQLSVGEAGGSEWCFSACSSKKVESFAEMLEKMENAATNDQLRARLRLRRSSFRAVRTLDKVVEGRRSVQLVVKDGSSEEKSAPEG